MSKVDLSEDLARAVERQVEGGRAPSMAAFVEMAVVRLLEDTAASDHEVLRAALDGIADVEAGRFTTVASPVDGRRLAEKRMERVLAGRRDAS